MAAMDRNGKVEYKPEELTPPDSVDYFIYRTDVAREHKHAKLWMIAFFVAFAVFVVTNVYWIWNEMQYVDEVVTVEAQTDQGGTAVANASGEVTINGESESNDQEENSQRNG